MDNKKLVIIGCGGMGIEALWAVSECGHRNVVFADDNKETHGTYLCGALIVGSIEDCIDKFGMENLEFMCAVGSVELKRKFVDRLHPEACFFSAVFPNVEASEFAQVGDGTLICAGSIITTQVDIGKHVIVNIDTTIGHDVIIEDYVTISPGVHISGYCTLREGCTVGLGANILPHITVGRNSIIGAGATVTGDVADNTTVVGVPAKVFKGSKV